MTLTQETYNALLAIKNGKPWFCHKALSDFLETVSVEEAPIEAPQEGKKIGTRTSLQNKSIHLWLSQLAEEMDRHGFTIQNVVSKIHRAEIRPTMLGLKEVLWRPYQIASVKKESTTQLTKQEVDKVYEGLNKFIGENFEIHIPFPSDELRRWEEIGGVKLAQHNNKNNEDYQDMDETNNANKF